MDLVLDTSFLVANRIEKDTHHKAARRLMGRIRQGEWEHLILSDHVLGETLTVVQRRAGHPAAVQYGQALLASDQISFLIAGETLFDAIKIFEGEQTGKLSVVDCLLVHLARAYGAPIATFDDPLGTMRGVKVVPG